MGGAWIPIFLSCDSCDVFQLKLTAATLQVRHSLMPSLPTDSTSLPYSKTSAPASYSKNSDLATGGFSSKTSELPPPPPPSQWSHLYSASATSSSHYDGPTYEVRH